MFSKLQSDSPAITFKFLTTFVSRESLVEIGLPEAPVYCMVRNVGKGRHTHHSDGQGGFCLFVEINYKEKIIFGLNKIQQTTLLNWFSFTNFKYSLNKAIICLNSLT